MIHAFVLFVIVAAASGSAERVITESDQGKILYFMIACGSSYRDRPEACHALEQRRIDTRLHRQWVEAARKLHQVALTLQEETDVAKQVTETRSHSEEAAAHFHALAVATVRLRRGEDRASVYMEASRQGITAEELDHELELRPTRDAAERVAAIDFEKQGEKASRDYYTSLYVIDHLWKIVNRRATEQHISFDAAEEQFWSEVITATHLKVVDSSFTLPARKGVLFSHEQQALVAH